MQTVVEKGCPNLFRKAVNSAKRLRVYLQVDEGHVCCLLYFLCFYLLIVYFYKLFCLSKIYVVQI